MCSQFRDVVLSKVCHVLKNHILHCIKHRYKTGCIKCAHCTQGILSHIATCTDYKEGHPALDISLHNGSPVPKWCKNNYLYLLHTGAMQVFSFTTHIIPKLKKAHKTHHRKFR